MVAGVVALAVLASVAATLPGLLGTALTYVMRRGGLGDATAEVTALGVTESRLNLRAAGMDTQVAVRHPWSALLRGRAERITVSGITVRPTDLQGRGGGGGIPALPADELVLAGSRVVLDSPGGPLTVAVEAVVRPEGDILTFTGTVTALGVTVEAKGRHDPARGTGSADLRLRPVRLREGQPNLAALVPRAVGAVVTMAGKVSGRAKLAWDGKGLTSSGEVLMEDLAGSAGPVGVGGLSGVLRLTSLWPPVLPSGQTLAVKTLDVGLPLTDGVVTLGLTRRGVLDIDRAEWRWAGGTVRAKPFEIALESPRGTIELEAEGLDLGTVLALASLEGLSADGRLRGTLPIRFASGKVRLDGGVLEAAAPGALRYDPATPPAGLQGDPGSPTALLLGALTDFRYESLSATVDGEAGGEMRVGLRIRGANPEFYGGHPVALNLNLSGALDRILRQGLDAYRIPDAVRERMLDYEKKGPS
ncbi:YdbH domain-containing protein [Azospirillum sp. TSO22-1]|uniref:YdbH domain-containing protein n=1 Tax=Azospirillum sp. TSO22-1 TaxID=716789 RepID=UPI000D65C740|nr:YdbH domain-containing protein [Azospirillum sp. TSO22-1]